MDSSEPDSVRKNRLLVLVPEGLAGNLDLAKKIYWMAFRSHYDVTYLAFVDNGDERLAISRSMATMKALTGDRGITASMILTPSHNWLNTLRENYRPGDKIVCHDEQYFRTGFLRAIPVCDALADIFAAPIESISGFYHPWHVLSRKWLFTLLFWLGIAVIFTLFSILEIQIDQTVQGFARTTLILIVLFLEFGAIWTWNHLPKI